jgi:hypothetical protein
LYYPRTGEVEAQLTTNTRMEARNVTCRHMPAPPIGACWSRDTSMTIAAIASNTAALRKITAKMADTWNRIFPPPPPPAE